MSILIGRFDFETAANAREIPSEAGLYAVLIEQNEGLFLIEVHETADLNLTLSGRVLKRNDRCIVYFVCSDKTERTEALNELLCEFEFEPDDSAQPIRNKRSETNAGIAVSL